MTSGELDAVLLGYAGLARIGRLDAVSQVFEPDEMLPAAGQGGSRFIERAEDLPVGGAEPFLLDQHLPHRDLLRVLGRPVVDGPQLHAGKISSPRQAVQ